MKVDRRDFIKLAGIGTVVVASDLMGFGRLTNAAGAESENFFFVQLSDTHWGFTGPAINPDASGTLMKAVDAVNNLKVQPDFIIFTGDLTHTTDDDRERRKRLTEFKEIVKNLRVKNVKFLPGEHDAGLDEGKAYQEIFGRTHYTFDHKGIHFIVIDNVSSPTSSIGDDQLNWLSADLNKQSKDGRIVIFTHRPLFDLYPDWDWHTRDAAKATDMLVPYGNVTVFYGHIHQEHLHADGNIVQRAARGLMYPLPAPGSVPVKKPVPWDAAHPYKGLGFREAAASARDSISSISEFSVKGEKL